MLDAGLFSSADARRVHPLPTFNPRCDRCGIYSTCRTPKMPVDGGGRLGILVVGERPGKAEDASGRPFTGASGRFLQEELRRVGIDLRRDCWLTNALICAPGADVPATAVDDCRPNLLKTIRDLEPRVVMLLGQAACQSFIAHAWKPDVGPVGRWAARVIPCQRPNAWVVPLWNPAHLLRDEAHPVERLMFRRTLAKVPGLPDRPHPSGAPDYDARAEVVHSPRDAAARLAMITGGTIAFDYEADRLKPDRPEADLICCSVCHEGGVSFCFPWQGPAVREMARILADPGISKIGFNVKYEDRWTKAKLGFHVAGWVWDGMLAAHVLDARVKSASTGLKFQAFVRLGAPDYSSHLDANITSGGDGQNEPNTLRQVNPTTLFTYCCYDAILEWEVAQHQMREMRGE